jgi:hypothetical protein
MTKKHHKIRFVAPLFLWAALVLSPMDATSAEPAVPPEVPVKDMVTMVDLGAPFCPPLQGDGSFSGKA